MNDIQFRAVLDWFMCSDPWPVSGANPASHDIIHEWITAESKARGYPNWVEAFHYFVPNAGSMVALNA